MSRRVDAHVPGPTMNKAGNNNEAEVIDLAALSRPARRVVDIYDQLTNGRPLKPGALDDALSDLDAAPHPAGQIGHDIELLASGGVGATREGVVSAIERLRRISTVQSEAAPTLRRWKAGPRHRRTPRNDGQLQLPGMDHDTGGPT